MEPSSIPPHVYQFRVVLQGISPLIWRRLLIRGDMSLATCSGLQTAAPGPANKGGFGLTFRANRLACEPRFSANEPTWGRKRLAAIRCKKMPLHRTGRDHMAAHERPPSLTPGSRHVFPQIGRTGTYPPECPSSRRWG